MKASKQASTRSYRRFDVRSDRGRIAEALPCYTSDLVRETDRGCVPASDDDVIAAALRILSRRVANTHVLSNPRVVREYLALRFAGLEHEVFACLCLNSRNRLIACEEVFRGTIDGASVHPREVVKRALANNAAAVILVRDFPVEDHPNKREFSAPPSAGCGEPPRCRMARLNDCRSTYQSGTGGAQPRKFCTGPQSSQQRGRAVAGG